MTGQMLPSDAGGFGKNQGRNGEYEAFAVGVLALLQRYLHVYTTQPPESPEQGVTFGARTLLQVGRTGVGYRVKKSQSYASRLLKALILGHFSIQGHTSAPFNNARNVRSPQANFFTSMMGIQEILHIWRYSLQPSIMWEPPTSILARLMRVLLSKVVS